MAVLELSILFDGKTILEHQFYNSTSEVRLNEDIRSNLMHAVVGLSQNAFQDEVKKFHIAEYIIMMCTDEIEIPGKEQVEKMPIRMYVIAISDSVNEKKVMKLMENAMFQFLNRFSYFDLIQDDPSKFFEFKERFNTIFHEVIEIIDHRDEEIKDAQKMRKMQNQLGNLRNHSNLGF